jgi:hypothetical protein
VDSEHEKEMAQAYMDFFCIFVICATALYGAWRIWLDPYRGTVSTFEQTEKLDTVLTGMQAAEDLKYIVDRLRERHPACISGLPAAIQKEYEQEYAELSESTEVTVLSLWQSASRVLACLDDAHTTVRAYYEDTKILPSFTVSYKYFIRPDATKSDLPLLPDLQVPAHDAMEETLRLIHKK